MSKTLARGTREGGAELRSIDAGTRVRAIWIGQLSGFWHGQIIRIPESPRLAELIS